MKTASEIIDKKYKKGMHWKSVNRANTIQAMNEYAEEVINELFVRYRKEHGYGSKVEQTFELLKSELK